MPSYFCWFVNFVAQFVYLFTQFAFHINAADIDTHAIPYQILRIPIFTKIYSPVSLILS